MASDSGRQATTSGKGLTTKGKAVETKQNTAFDVGSGTAARSQIIG